MGASREGSWSPVGAQEGPRGLQEPFWHHLGSENGAPRPHFGSLFGHVGALFWSPSPFAVSGLASMLISWPWLPDGFGSAVSLQKWGPQSALHFSSCLSSSLACSWSSLLFAGFEALILKVRSPRGLKPRVAAGGREATRIVLVILVLAPGGPLS